MIKMNKTSRTTRPRSATKLETIDHGSPVNGSPGADIPEHVLNVVEALDCELAIEDGDDRRPNTPEEDRLDEWLEARARMIRMTSPIAD